MEKMKKKQPLQIIKLGSKGSGEQNIKTKWPSKKTKIQYHEPEP